MPKRFDIASMRMRRLSSLLADVVADDVFLAFAIVIVNADPEVQRLLVSRLPIEKCSAPV